MEADTFTQSIGIKMGKSIGWINDQWGSPSDLRIPIQDRGLTLGDGIFETILIFHGQPKLLREHLKRWEKTAFSLGMQKPPKEKWLISIINEGVKKLSLEQRNGILRLNWSRGDSLDRGINLPTSHVAPNHRFWLEIHTGDPDFNHVSTIISTKERRNPYSSLSHCKTFAYNEAIQARREAMIAGADDALLLSTTGEVCCGSTSNLIIQRKDKWLTPPLESGCLPGIMRAQALRQGLASEEYIEAEPKEGDQWLLINSLGCKPITQLNGKLLKIFPKAKELWLSLLDNK